MKDKDTGGPAFPAHGRWGRDGQLTDALQYSGVTLRDYFAAKAMQGFAADHTTGEASSEEIANLAYMWADAMLKAREA